MNPASANSARSEFVLGKRAGMPDVPVVWSITTSPLNLNSPARFCSSESEVRNSSAASAARSDSLFEVSIAPALFLTRSFETIGKLSSSRGSATHCR